MIRNNWHVSYSRICLVVSEQMNSLPLHATKHILFCRVGLKVFICSFSMTIRYFWSVFRYFACECLV
jgi:hypothetical protein